jgi:hypothetical protein
MKPYYNRAPVERRVIRLEYKTMTFKLGTNIKVGNKIKTSTGWRKVLDVTDEGAKTKDGIVKFGETVYGWKAV